MKTSTILKRISSMVLVAAVAMGKSSAQSIIYASANSGTTIQTFSLTNATRNADPAQLANPNLSFPNTTTGAIRSAAIGRNAQPAQATGFFYWTGNTGFLNNQATPNQGVVEVWASDANGNGQIKVGSADLNTAGNTSELGFVRLGMSPTGKGYILASDNATTLILAEFQSNGLNPVTITVTDPSVQLVGGAVATFKNGDICFSGQGNIYALANNDQTGATQIFTGAPNGVNTVLTKKFDLIENANGPGPGDDIPFTGTVNGLAFDVLGSLYVSASGGAPGLYWINQATVNGPNQTVDCVTVSGGPISGLTDLASYYFPNETLLPVDLISFTGALKGSVTTLNWETENEQNFDHFEIERRADNAGNYVQVGIKSAVGGSGHYSFDDNLGLVTGKAFNYRLKAVDVDGKFKYSNVILVRKDQKSITGIAVNPNPVIGGLATIRFTSLLNGTAVFNVLDLGGKVVLTQQERVYEGNNSITLNNLDRLQPGNYLLQMKDGENTLITKFTVSR